MYFPFAQDPGRGLQLVIRAKVDPTTLVTVLRESLRRLDPDVPVTELAAMDQLVAGSMAQPRLRSRLLALFAAVALLLSVIGLYGTLNYFVAERRRELGIRMALGARVGDITRLVVSRGMLLAGIGLGTGLLAAIALTRVMSSLLFDIASTDWTTFGSVTLLLACVALLTCWLPARRAAQLAPTLALRDD
jgi:putative ABC transport system permease protein